MRTMCVMCVVCVLGIAATVPAQAAILDVGGGGYATIQLAINAASDGDTINILSNITENNISVNKSLTIRGQGADLTTVQAHATRGAANNRIFNLTGSNKTITFEDLTLKHGDSTGTGGAINMDKWKGNPTLIINRVAFVDNDAATGGGAVMMNEQSAAANKNGTLRITDSTFSGNEVADGSGGALFAQTLGEITVRNSTFSGNTANTDSAWNNFGGAMHIRAFGELAVGLVQNCTFVGNSMLGFGAVTNQTGGGAIYGSVKDNVESCVFAGNSTLGRGIVNLDRDTGMGTIINCLSEGDILTWTTDGGGNTQNAADAGVDPNLADNGGPTMTHALLAGSPAIDAGSNPASLSYDQRGPGYVRTYGAGTDAGAYEYVPEPATLGLLALGTLGLTALRRRRK